METNTSPTIEDFNSKVSQLNSLIDLEKTENHEEIRKFLTQYNKLFAVRVNVELFDLDEINLTKITFIDLIINNLAAICIHAKTLETEKSVLVPLFEPNALRNHGIWTHTGMLSHLEYGVSVDPKEGICVQLHKVFLSVWTEEMSTAFYSIVDEEYPYLDDFVSILVVEISEYWEMFSGNQYYPVPAPTSDLVVEEVKKQQQRNFSKAQQYYGHFSKAQQYYGHCVQKYVGTYGDLRLDLAKFLLNHLVKHRLFDCNF